MVIEVFLTPYLFVLIQWQKMLELPKIFALSVQKYPLSLLYHRSKIFFCLLFSLKLVHPFHLAFAYPFYWQDFRISELDVTQKPQQNFVEEERQNC
jgi:hypothetical protein